MLRSAPQTAISTLVTHRGGYCCPYDGRFVLSNTSGTSQGVAVFLPTCATILPPVQPVCCTTTPTYVPVRLPAWQRRSAVLLRFTTLTLRTRTCVPPRGAVAAADGRRARSGSSPGCVPAWLCRRMLPFTCMTTPPHRAVVQRALPCADTRRNARGCWPGCACCRAT